MATTHVLFLVLLMSMMPLLDGIDASDITNDIIDNMKDISDNMKNMFNQFTAEDTTKFIKSMNEQGTILTEAQVNIMKEAFADRDFSNLDKDLLEIFKKASAAWSNSGTRGSAAVAVVLPILMLTINMVM